jgi:hypothetical protein
VRDEETAHIAFEYAARYEQRRTVLERKVVALEDERVIRAVEFQEMAERLREAQGKRDTLAAAAGSSDSDETIRAADNLLEELDCLAGDMTDLSPGPRRTQEMDDIDREFRNLSVDPWPPIRKSEMDPNAVLE